jgi:hydroxymethylpyrimidine pyrophosphatase-like HAD family hydrolase
MKTVFCDIDGTLVKHNNRGLSGQLEKAEILSGVIEKFNQWQANGYSIVLTTGRVESMRNRTIEQLSGLGIFWDHLIMGLPNGQRILINDLKSGVTNSEKQGNETAVAICLERNKGLSGVKL